jgi:hypothetical protein
MPLLTVREPDVESFIQLSWDLNRQDPRWIPPMRARLRQELTGQDAFGRYGRMQLFGCESDGRLVGRIAAIINPRLLDPGGPLARWDISRPKTTWASPRNCSPPRLNRCARRAHDRCGAR